MNIRNVVGSVARVLVAIVALLLPNIAYAQATIAGVVRDASGAVLPGVTVEAASPALIERTRVVVTDGTGQYQIVDLRPGTYMVTFSLVGFSTVRRENVELSGSFAATINAELRVGTLEETITVTGESPIVDVQNVRGQPVIDHEVIDAVPAARNVNSLAALLPGVTHAGPTDVGGAAGDNMSKLVVHGSRLNEYRLNLDGVPTSNSTSGGAASSFAPNLSGVQEIVVDTSSASAETGSGAPRVNLIPKDGGNTFSGTLFATGATPAFQSNNITDDLRRRGLSSANDLKAMYDFNPGIGGPLRRDKVWFYASVRLNAADIYTSCSTASPTLGCSQYQNVYRGNPNVYTYAPDTSRRHYLNQRYAVASLRLTSQVTPKNKISFMLDQQTRTMCGTNEIERCFKTPVNGTGKASWTAPVTSRLLLEAGLGYRAERWRHADPPPEIWNLIGVTDQGLGMAYRARVDNFGKGTALYWLISPQASVSYVTGAHAFKAGYIQIRDRAETTNGGPGIAQIAYRFNNGVPNQVTEFAYPLQTDVVGNQYALYAQDKWIVGRLSINAGVRYDHFSNYYPETTAGPALLTPTRNFTFPREDSLNYDDVTPRFGMAYDLFGDRKTALKVSINKYMAQFIGSGPLGNQNPAALMANQVSRQWTDSNTNYIVDCDLLNPGAQNRSASGGDICGAMSDVNFGKPTRTTRIDPEMLTTRPFNWEFSAGVQRELGPRVGLDVGYFRRWYGNFAVTDNLAVTAADYSPFSVTAPSDPRLPNGGGYTISGFVDLNPNRFGQVDNLIVPADRYGKQMEHWNGVDVSLNARLPQGILAQGAVSVGRTETDNCEILAHVPEVSPLGRPYCHQSTGFKTNIKALAAYTIPVVDVHLAATFMGLVGEQNKRTEYLAGLAANYVVPNALIAPSLGRNLSGGANATVNLLAPGQLWGDRLNLLDLRFGKLLRFGRLRTVANLDINNALNSSNVTDQNPTYGPIWRRPESIIAARLVRISLQMDF